MSARVVYLRGDQPADVPWTELGRSELGAWGVVDDARWLAEGTRARFELLYLSEQDYSHAVRRLAACDLEDAVLLRRRSFSADIAQHALGLVLEQIKRRLLASDVERESWLSLMTELVGTPRHAYTPFATLIVNLIEGESGLRAEFASGSLAEARVHVDPGEKLAREGFREELGKLAEQHGLEALRGGSMFVPIERVYLVTGPIDELEAALEASHDPHRRWRDGLLAAFPERELPDLALDGCSAQVAFPALGTFMSLSSTLTPAQFDVEVQERLANPGLEAHLVQLRLVQAVLRRSVRALASANDAAWLTPQVQTETQQLAVWCGGARGDAPSLHDMRADAFLLSQLCRHEGRAEAGAQLAELVESLDSLTRSFT